MGDVWWIAAGFVVGILIRVAMKPWLPDEVILSYLLLRKWRDKKHSTRHRKVFISEFGDVVVTREGIHGNLVDHWSLYTTSPERGSVTGADVRVIWRARQFLSGG